MFPTFWNQLHNVLETFAYWLASTFNLSKEVEYVREFIQEAAWLFSDFLDALFHYIPNLFM